MFLVATCSFLWMKINRFLLYFSFKSMFTTFFKLFNFFSWQLGRYQKHLIIIRVFLALSGGQLYFSLSCFPQALSFDSRFKGHLGNRSPQAGSPIICTTTSLTQFNTIFIIKSIFHKPFLGAWVGGECISLLCLRLVLPLLDVGSWRLLAGQCWRTRPRQTLVFLMLWWFLGWKPVCSSSQETKLLYVLPCGPGQLCVSGYRVAGSPGKWVTLKILLCFSHNCAQLLFGRYCSVHASDYTSIQNEIK